jgi:Na+-translocating ferredoxin:NAD+ oxidoreductase subunit B
MIAVLLLFAVAASIAGLCRLGLQRLQLNRASIEKQINAQLPQTQCGLCGYVGCRPYARAIANGEADINRCPPGGDVGVEKLARLLKVNPKALDRSRGIGKTPAVAIIDEARCIGCTLCIQVCPVDAIIGAAKQMHSVLRRDCTGCELCIPPCPVDCIDMLPIPAGAH